VGRNWRRQCGAPSLSGGRSMISRSYIVSFRHRGEENGGLPRRNLDESSWNPFHGQRANA
jgi:hypothetical protein